MQPGHYCEGIDVYGLPGEGPFCHCDPAILGHLYYYYIVFCTHSWYDLLQGDISFLCLSIRKILILLTNA